MTRTCLALALALGGCFAEHESLLLDIPSADLEPVCGDLWLQDDDRALVTDVSACPDADDSSPVSFLFDAIVFR